MILKMKDVRAEVSQNSFPFLSSPLLSFLSYFSYFINLIFVFLKLPFVFIFIFVVFFLSSYIFKIIRYLCHVRMSFVMMLMMTFLLRSLFRVCSVCSYSLLFILILILPPPLSPPLTLPPSPLSSPVTYEFPDRIQILSQL